MQAGVADADPILIRETDICTDAYYDLLEALASKSADETGPVFSKLRYHIRSIADMEKLRLGNIL